MIMLPMDPLIATGTSPNANGNGLFYTTRATAHLSLFVSQWIAGAVPRHNHGFKSSLLLSLSFARFSYQQDYLPNLSNQISSLPRAS
jgi:hypothetical protein